METLYPSPPESDSLNANPFENPRTLPMIARGKAGESASDNGGNPFLFSATTATPPIYQQVKRFADGHRGASEGDVGDSDTHRQQQHVYGSKGVAVLHYQVIKSSLQQQQSQQQQQRRLNMNNVYPQQSENLVDVAGMFHSNSMSAINSWSGDGKHSRSLVSAPPQLPQQTVPAAMSTTSFVQQGRQQINASPTSPTASSYFGTPQPWSSPIDDSEVFRSPTLNRSIMNSNVKFTLQTLGISDEDSIPPARHVLASLSSSLNPSASATATQTSNDSSQSSSGIFPSDPHHFKEFTAGNGYFSSRNYINVSSYGVGGARSAVSDDRGMGGGIEKKVDGSSGDGGGLTVDSFLPFHQTYKGCQLLPPPQYASVGGGGGSGNTIYHPQQQHHHYQQQQYLSQYPQHLTHSEYRQPQGGRGRSGEHQHAFDRRGGFTQQIHGQPHHAPPYVAATGPSSDTQQMVNQQQRILELEALLMANKLL